MTFRVFLNNQSVAQAYLLPHGQKGNVTRYIFIQGRDDPIIICGEKSTLPQESAVGVNDGKNPHYQLGYQDEGNIRITLIGEGGKLRYNANSGYTTVEHLL